MNRIAPPEEIRANAFVVTKPLQIIVALSIISQLEISATSVMIITDSFAGARGVSERLPDLQMPVSGLSAIFVSSVPEAYRYLRENRFSAVFIDSDVGLQKYGDLLRIRFSNPKAAINVYEEGIGTYRTDLYHGIKHGIKKALFPFIGAGTHFGGCKLISSIYLIYPEEYMATFPRSHAALVRIDKGPSTIVGSFFDDLSWLFQHTPLVNASSDRCNVYLSSWSLDEEFLGGFRSFPGDNYIKPHPHIKNIDDDSGMIINQSVPAEIVIIDLMKLYKNIFVYHHGSSLEKYISSERVQYVRI